jgi:hypothetical protein
MVNTLYLAAPGTISIDMRDAGNIVGISISCSDAAGGSVEVGFNSSPSYTTTDTTGVIAAAIYSGNGFSGNQYFEMKEPVDVGERIFLHNSALNAVRVLVYTDAATVRAPTRRR